MVFLRTLLGKADFSLFELDIGFRVLVYSVVWIVELVVVAVFYRGSWQSFFSTRLHPHTSLREHAGS